MSRTTVHAPFWVVAMREGHIEHDHSHGECNVAPVHSDGVVLRHHRNCKKIIAVKSIACDHTKKSKVFRTIHERLTGKRTVEHNVTCDFTDFKTCFGVRRTVHELYEVVRDEDIHCSCDDLPRGESFSCYVDVPGYKSRKYFESHGRMLSCGCCSSIDRTPSSNKVRMNLSGAAAMWNSMTDEEREDFFDWDVD